MVGSFLLNFALGILTSLLFWWIFAHAIVPRLEFSPKIRKAKEFEKWERPYAFKVQNSGLRKIIDLQCYVRMKYTWDDNKSWTSVAIPTTTQGERSTTVALLGRGSTHTYALYLQGAKELATNGNFSQEFRKRACSGKLTLEEVFNQHPSAQLVVEILGYDRFSGARKLFDHVYTQKDVQQGSFQYRGVLLQG